MKTLSTYLNETVKLNEEAKSLQEIYEHIGYRMIEGDLVAEGLSDSFKEIAPKLSINIDDLKNNAKKFASEISDAGKKAIENVKKAAGQSWEKIKMVYSSIIILLDKILMPAAKMIDGLADIVGISTDKMKEVIANTYVYLMTQNGVSKEITSAVVHIPKTQKQILGITLAIFVASFANSHLGGDLDNLINIMKVVKSAGSYTAIQNVNV